jgi:hypothetical protein
MSLRAKYYAYLVVVPTIAYLLIVLTIGNEQPPLIGFGIMALLLSGLLLFRCPDCRKPIWISGPMIWPFPGSRCSRCGHSLTAH